MSYCVQDTYTIETVFRLHVSLTARFLNNMVKFCNLIFWLSPYKVVFTKSPKNLVGKLTTAWIHHSLVRFINYFIHIIQNNLCNFCFSWDISTFKHRINDKIKDTSSNYTDTKILIRGEFSKVLAQLCNYCWQHKSPLFL